MSDNEIYKVILASFESGWEILYRKYNITSYRAKIGIGFTVGYNKASIQDAWADAIYDTCYSVRAGRFVRQAEGPDFFAPYITTIAQRKLLKGKKQVISHLPPEAEDDIIVDDIDKGDMLMLHIAAFSLKNLYRDIILLKYFPDSNVGFNLTDEKICTTLIQMGHSTLDKDQLGVYRRRALTETGKRYQKMNKESLEKEIAALLPDDFVLLNLNYPVSELLGLLCNSGAKYPEVERSTALRTFLFTTQNNQQQMPDPRLRAYPSDAVKWTNSFFPRAIAWSEQSVMGRIKDYLNAFINKFF